MANRVFSYLGAGAWPSLTSPSTDARLEGSSSGKLTIIGADNPSYDSALLTDDAMPPSLNRVPETSRRESQGS